MPPRLDFVSSLVISVYCQLRAISPELPREFYDSTVSPSLVEACRKSGVFSMAIIETKREHPRLWMMAIVFVLSLMVYLADGRSHLLGQSGDTDFQRAASN